MDKEKDGPAGPTQNQEVTTSKIVTFFLVPVWCQDLENKEEFLVEKYT